MIENKDIHIFLYVKDEIKENIYYDFIKKIRKEKTEFWISTYCDNYEKVYCGSGENNFLCFDNLENIENVFINHTKIIGRDITIFYDFNNVFNFDNIFFMKKNKENFYYEGKEYNKKYINKIIKGEF